MYRLENRADLLAIAAKCRLGASMGLAVSFEADAALALAELLESLIELAESNIDEENKPDGIGN